MEFITLRPLVAPSLRSGATAQGLRVINSVDPCVLESNYYIEFYDNLVDPRNLIHEIYRGKITLNFFYLENHPPYGSTQYGSDNTL